MVVEFAEVCPICTAGAAPWGGKELQAIKIELGFLYRDIKQYPNSLAMRDGVAELEQDVGVQARQISYETVAFTDCLENCADDRPAAGKQAFPAFYLDDTCVADEVNCRFYRLGARGRSGRICDETFGDSSHPSDFTTFIWNPRGGGAWITSGRG